MKTDTELLKDANELIRSFYQVTARSGKETNWDALMKRIETILEEQHLRLKDEKHETKEKK